MAINKEEKGLVVALAVIGVAYFALLKPITDKLGLTKTDKEKAEAELKEQASSNPGWNPKYNITARKKYPRATVLKEETATALAKQIYNAWGKINDNEQAIFAAFRVLASQIQLSQLTAKYAALYKQDLLTRLKAPWYYLSDGLDEKEFTEIAKIVTALPENFIKK